MVVNVGVDVSVVVGVVILHSAKVPSRNESIAADNVDTVELQLSSSPRYPPILPEIHVV